MNGTNSSAKHYDRALPDITTPYKPPKLGKKIAVSIPQIFAVL
jgi:hypothetical protein